MPLILSKNFIAYLNDVFLQPQTKKSFKVLDKKNKIFLKENLKTAPDESHFFLTPVKFHGQIRHHNTPLRSRIDAILRLQPLCNKNKIQLYIWDSRQ